jgi:hypothetical protein
MAYRKILSRNLLGEAEENYENLKYDSRWPSLNSSPVPPASCSPLGESLRNYIVHIDILTLLTEKIR